MPDEGGEGGYYLCPEPRLRTDQPHGTGSSAMKKDTHPTYYPSCKVYHNGEVVMTVGATVPEM